MTTPKPISIQLHYNIIQRRKVL